MTSQPASAAAYLETGILSSEAASAPLLVGGSKGGGVQIKKSGVFGNVELSWVGCLGWGDW